jgi:CBS-domain-containing membrane protein
VRSGIDLAWRLAGAALALSLCLYAMERSSSGLLLASIAGSTLFVFGLPDAPAAQPRAIGAGHAASALAGWLCLQTLGPGSPAMIVGVVIAMLFMLLTRTLHPPAGANPLLIVDARADGSALLDPGLTSVATLLVVACVWMRWGPGARYPRDWKAASPPRAH